MENIFFSKLWKTLKQSRVQNKRSPCTSICIEARNGLTLDVFTISQVLKKFFFNLANNLVYKFPAAAEKFGNKYVEDHYNNV